MSLLYNLCINNLIDFYNKNSPCCGAFLSLRASLVCSSRVKLVLVFLKIFQ